MDNPYGHIDVFPVGVNPPAPKKDIIRVSGGDTIVLSDAVFDMFGRPVSMDKHILSFVLKDQKFSDESVWTGGWMDGITEGNRPGMVVVKIPNTVSESLRRGSYVYSLLVSDRLLDNRVTRMRGSLLVEYEATSPHTSIPYKDGADPEQSYQRVSSDIKYVTGVNAGGRTYAPDVSGTVYLPPGTGPGNSCVLPLGDRWYKLCLKLVDGELTSYWVESTDDPVPATVSFGGELYTLRLTRIDGVITSYWEKLEADA